MGYSPWGRKELDTTERLRDSTSLHFIVDMGFLGGTRGKEPACHYRNHKRRV